MPRGPRRRSESGLYHVMLRGINRQIIFESEDDRYQLLWTLKRLIDANSFVLQLQNYKRQRDRNTVLFCGILEMS